LTLNGRVIGFFSAPGGVGKTTLALILGWFLRRYGYSTILILVTGIEYLIDRHEMRFIIRTGIYHACSVKSESDPLEKSHFQYILTRFCDAYLSGYKVKGIDLGEAPGIVDIFIWSYCADERYKICAKILNCEKCNLKGVCLYAITNEGSI